MHATAGLVDRDRLQLYHINYSVILVSSAIDFSGGDGLEKFIASIIAFHCLSSKRTRIPDTLASKNTDPGWSSKVPENDRVVRGGTRLEFSGNGPRGFFTVGLADIIFRDPATVGRSTTVVSAASDRWPDTGLTVKVSWPDSGRVPETDFLAKANDEAQKTEGKWATRHLPQMFYSEDVVGPDPVARLFDEVGFVAGECEYERRTLRVIIQERLHPLKSLAKVKDIGQVFLDVACSAYIPPFLMSVHSHRFSTSLAL